MQQYNLNAAWAYWKEGSIYKQGLDQLQADPTRGCMLLQKASEAGHTVAKSDLALCYYEGLGVNKDLKKALQLLTEANEASRLVNSQYLDEDDPDAEAEGDYEEQLAQIKQELNK
ncbi:hypothetical protein [Paraflavitalea speifideaquila]|uniref:hypothetical protein n=1 Tax=Paraflavitalea speifideaquila TaxID=3076558 RepID=UPI0028F0E7C7|nr:hypothetical protein [Paraflavitalea speifideiaquila]